MNANLNTTGWRNAAPRIILAMLATGGFGLAGCRSDKETPRHPVDYSDKADDAYSYKPVFNGAMRNLMETKLADNRGGRRSGE